MVICFDIDGVLAHWNIAYAYKIVNILKKDLFPKGWKRNPDLLAPVWYWDTHWGYTKEETELVANKIYYQEDARFWEELPLMPLAKDVLRCLNELIIRDKHEVYFITHRVGVAAKLQTERWLYGNGIAYPTVMLVDAKNKPAVLAALNADIFIDDKLETVQRSVGMAKRVYLQDAPYNQEQFKTTVYTRVNSAVAMLKVEGLWRESPVKKAMFWRK